MQPQARRGPRWSGEGTLLGRWRRALNSRSPASKAHRAAVRRAFHGGATRPRRALGRRRRRSSAPYPKNTSGPAACSAGHDDHIWPVQPAPATKSSPPLTATSRVPSFPLSVFFLSPSSGPDPAGRGLRGEPRCALGSDVPSRGDRALQPAPSSILLLLLLTVFGAAAASPVQRGPWCWGRGGPLPPELNSEGR